MEMALMAVAWLVPIVAAFLAVSRLLGGAGSSAPMWRWVLHLSLAVGIGLGACTLFLFVWLMVFGPPGAAYFVTESALGLLLIAALLALTWRERRASKSSPTPEVGSASQRRRLPLSRVQKLIAACFGIVVLVSAVSLAYWVLLMPHGGWDAWAIWNLRARFIFRAGESWPQAFGAFMPHTDYPLLIPLSVVRGWAYLGSEVQIAPAATAALFAVATAGLMVASVAERRGTTLGLLAGMVLLTTPLYLEQGAMQTADVPLAFFLLATTVLLAFYERTGRLQPLFLAGVTAGLASWTKNEGLLLVAAVVAAGAALALKQGRDRPAWKTALVLLAGIAPALLIGLWFKAALAPPNDLIANQSGQTLAKLADPSRYALILGAAWGEVWRHYGWLPVLVVGLFVCGYDWRQLPRAALGVLGVMALGYFMIYLTTPLDLTYHLGSSLYRLLLQVWPIGLLIFFAGVRAPEAWSVEVLP